MYVAINLHNKTTAEHRSTPNPYAHVHLTDTQKGRVVTFDVYCFMPCAPTFSLTLECCVWCIAGHFGYNGQSSGGEGMAQAFTVYPP